MDGRGSSNFSRPIFPYFASVASGNQYQGGLEDDVRPVNPRKADLRRSLKNLVESKVTSRKF